MSDPFIFDIVDGDDVIETYEETIEAVAPLPGPYNVVETYTPVPGPTGPEGPEGPQGERGPIGPEGPPGGTVIDDLVLSYNASGELIGVAGTPSGRNSTLTYLDGRLNTVTNYLGTRTLTYDGSGVLTNVNWS